MFIEHRNSSLLRCGQVLLFLAIVLVLLGIAPAGVQAHDAASSMPPLPAPNLTAPVDRSNIAGVTPLLKWTAVPGAAYYEFEVLPLNSPGALPVAKSVSASSYQVEHTDNLIYGTTYMWLVMAFPTDIVNFSPNISGFYQFTTSIQKSPTDGAFSASPAVTFKWASVPGALNYDLFLSTDPSTVLSQPAVHSGKQTSFTVSGLSYGPHYWEVCVVRSSGQEDCPAYPLGQNPWEVIVTQALPPAPLLTGPKSLSFSPTSLATFSWQAIDKTSVVPGGPFDYQIQIDTLATFTHPSVDARQPHGGLSSDPQTFTYTLADGIYYWRVRTINAINAAGKWSAPWTINIASAPLPSPQLLAPADNSASSSSRPTFKWAKIPGAIGYKLEISNSADGSAVPVTWNCTNTSYTLSSHDQALANGNYTWWVVSVNPAGVENARIAMSHFSVAAGQPAASAPTAPLLMYPGANARINDNPIPTFSWGLPGDTTLTPLSPELQVSSSPLFPANPASTLTEDLPASTITWPSWGAQPDGTYYWRVRAINALDVSGPWSEVRTLSIKATKPDMPMPIWPRDVNVSQQKPTFTWTAVSGAASYTVGYVVSGAALPFYATVTSNSYTPKTPFDYGYVNWWVMANDGYGNLSNTMGNGFYIPIQNSPLDGAKVSDPTKLIFKWNAYPSATSYHLEVLDGSSKSVIKQDISAPATSYTPSPDEAKLLLPGGYTWSVVVSKVPSDPTFLPPTPTPNYQLFITSVLPAAPVLLAPADKAVLGPNNLPAANWLNVAFAKTYQVQVSHFANFPATPGLTIPLSLPYLPWTTYGQIVIPPCSPLLNEYKWTCYWRVSGINADGAAGPWSAVRSFVFDMTPMVPPTLLSPLNGSSVTNPQLSLSWSAAADADGYDIIFTSGPLNDPNTDSSSAPSHLGKVTSYKLPVTIGEGLYSWSVRSCNAVENPSKWSAVQTFTMIAGLSVPKTPTPTATLTDTPTEPTLTPTPAPALTDTPSPLTPTVTATPLPTDPTIEPSATATPLATDAVVPTATPEDTAVAPEPTSTPTP